MCLRSYAEVYCCELLQSFYSLRWDYSIPYEIYLVDKIALNNSIIAPYQLNIVPLVNMLYSVLTISTGCALRFENLD